MRTMYFVIELLANLRVKRLTTYWECASVKWLYRQQYCTQTYATYANANVANALLRVSSTFSFAFPRIKWLTFSFRHLIFIETWPLNSLLIVTCGGVLNCGMAGYGTTFHRKLCRSLTLKSVHFAALLVPYGLRWFYTSCWIWTEERLYHRCCVNFTSVPGFELPNSCVVYTI